MKSQILILLGSVGISFAGFAQGSVNWAVISFASVTAQTNTTASSFIYGGGSLPGGTVGDVQGSASLGTGYYFELLIGSVWNGASEAPPSTLAGLSSWTDSGLEATNSNTAGRLVPINANAGAAVTQLSTTVSNNIMLVGWSANLGGTWSTVLANVESGNWTGNAFFGESAVGYIKGLATGTAPGSSVFGNVATLDGLPIYSLDTQLYLLPTPEPGPMSLVVLGGASLLLFRRKK